MDTVLTFLKDLPRYDDEKPFRFVGFPNLPTEWQSNCEYVEQKGIRILDVRGHEDTFHLDEYGFAFRQHQSVCDLRIEMFHARNRDLSNLTAYLEESIALMRAELGEQRVVCFDWRVSFRAKVSLLYQVDECKIRENLPSAVSIPAEEAENIRHYAIPPASNIHCGLHWYFTKSSFSLTGL